MKATRAAVVVAVLAAALIAGGVTWAARGSGDGSTMAAPDPASVVVTSLPGLTAATSEPDLAGLATARPAPGAVTQVSGPFDDRFTLHDLRLGATTVTGEVEVTSDVSDILELQVLVGFYDAQGTLLGTGRYTHHLDEDTHAESGTPTERETFSVTIPAALRGTVRGAAVGVPVLVNE